MHPPYNEFEQYDLIFFAVQSNWEARKRKRCKYQTNNDIGALVERDYIISGIEYNMDDIMLIIDVSREAECLNNNHFHHK